MTVFLKYYMKVQLVPNYQVFVEKTTHFCLPGKFKQVKLCCLILMAFKNLPHCFIVSIVFSTLLIVNAGPPRKEYL